MKKLAFTLVALMIVGVSHAQLFTLGPKVGISSTNLSVRDNITDFQNGDRTYGFHAGLFARVKVMGFYVQPEALYTNAGGQLIDFTDAVNNPAGTVVDYRFNRLDVPVMLGYKFGPARAFAGPVASVTLSARELRDAVETDISDLYDGAAWAFQAGVGVDIFKLTVDLKYEGSLGRYGDLANAATGNTVNLDQRATQLMLSLGYKLR